MWANPVTFGYTISVPHSLHYYKDELSQGISKSFVLIYEAKIFLSHMCGTTAQSKTGWLNERLPQADDLICCVPWLLLHI